MMNTVIYTCIFAHGSVIVIFEILINSYKALITPLHDDISQRNINLVPGPLFYRVETLAKAGHVSPRIWEITNK